ncbi:MAG: oligosaccharide flippase family protein [Chloroflexota bacterium]|nr:oligosaccharide flippase family protein [Chloroflexota bacterium]
MARIGTQAALALFSIVVARRLGAAGFGEYAFVASILFVANVLTSFGTDMLLVREIAAHRGAALAAPALALQLALALAIVALVALLAPLAPAQSATAVAALRLGSLTLLPLAPYTVLSAMLRGGARMRAYAALNLAVASAQVVAAALFVRPAGTVLDVAAVLVATQCFAAFAAVAACRLSGVALGPLARDPRPRLRALLARSAPIAVLGALGMLYQRAPVLVVSTIAGPAATGVFSAALRGVEAAKTVHVAAWSALYPAFAEDRARERSARSTVPRSLPALVLLALAAAAVLSVAADPLVAVLFGPAFLPAAAALRILAWVLVPYTVSSHRSLELLAEGRESEVTRALMLAVVALAVLGSVAVRSSGVVGACWAVLAAECVQAIALSAPWRLARPLARARQAGYPR